MASALQNDSTCHLSDLNPHTCKGYTAVTTASVINCFRFTVNSMNKNVIMLRAKNSAEIFAVCMGLILVCVK